MTNRLVLIAALTLAAGLHPRTLRRPPPIWFSSNGKVIMLDDTSSIIQAVAITQSVPASGGRKCAGLQSRAIFTI